MKDINGTYITVGSKVFVYQQRYESQQDEDGVWLVDQSKPLPVTDVPLASGVIEWDDDLLSYIVRYDWTCDSWNGKAGAQMGGGNYAYELID